MTKKEIPIDGVASIGKLPPGGDVMSLNGIIFPTKEQQDYHKKITEFFNKLDVESKPSGLPHSKRSFRSKTFDTN